MTQSVLYFVNKITRRKGMTKILILCHGNICRSPMGKFVLQDMVNKAGLSDQFEIDSAAVSREEIGNPVYPPARREMAKQIGRAHV